MISPMRACILAQKSEAATASSASLLATPLPFLNGFANHTHIVKYTYTRYTHAHHVPHTEHMEQSDKMVKHSRDDVEDFEDVSWTPCCPPHVPFTGQQRRRLSSITVFHCIVTSSAPRGVRAEGT